MQVLLKIFIGLVITTLLALSAPLLTDKSEGMAYQVETVASGLDSIPWGMTFIDEATMIITLIEGDILLLNTKSGSITPVFGMPTAPLYGGQGGLLDVALSPDFASTGHVYFTYVKNINYQGVTTLSRATLQGALLSDWKDILITQSESGTSRHFGSRITFDNQGHLYFGIGDRGERKTAQNLNSHHGTILRLNLDGSVPEDNPFIDNPKALNEIYSYGHRNPQGLVFDPATTRLWSIEHGPRGGDELNLIQQGRNYGWPVISYGKEYWGPVAVGEGVRKEGMEQPVKEYTPSIAPSSLMVYHGEAFPKWQGNLFAGALKLLHVNRIVLDEDGAFVKEERLLEKLGLRIRNVIEGPEGFLYLATDSGEILKLSPR